MSCENDDAGTTILTTSGTKMMSEEAAPANASRRVQESLQAPPSKKRKRNAQVSSNVADTPSSHSTKPPQTHPRLEIKEFRLGKSGLISKSCQVDVGAVDALVYMGFLEVFLMSEELRNETFSVNVKEKKGVYFKSHSLMRSIKKLVDKWGNDSILSYMANLTVDTPLETQAILLYYDKVCAVHQDPFEKLLIKFGGSLSLTQGQSTRKERLLQEISSTKTEVSMINSIGNGCLTGLNEAKENKNVHHFNSLHEYDNGTVKPCVTIATRLRKKDTTVDTETVMRKIGDNIRNMSNMFANNGSLFDRLTLVIKSFIKQNVSNDKVPKDVMKQLRKAIVPL